MPHLIGEEGPLKGTLINLDEREEWIIGRDPDLSHITLADSSVSRKHAFLFKDVDGLCIKDLGNTNPILVNDQNITETHLLKEGDRIKIGNTIFLYSEEKPPEEIVHEPIANTTEPKEETIYALEEKAKEAPEEKYDTIFDEGSVEDLLLPRVNEKNLILKVLSGPNVGAEFRLEKEKSYLIGKDPLSCDIIFNDLSVSRKHARLSIDMDGNIFLEDLGSRNGSFINQQPLAEKKLLGSQDLVSMGTTSFVVIDQKEQEETIYSPSPEKEVIEEPKVEVAVTEEAPKEKPFNWRELVIPQKHLIIAGSLGTILLVAFISFFSLFKSHKVEVAVKDETSQVKECLQKYEDVQFTYNPQGETLFLVGHVLTKVNHEELLYSLQQFPFLTKIEDNIIVDELVWKSMNDVLVENEGWKGISIHSPKAGRFEVVGFVKSAADATRLAEYLNVNFPYVGRLDNKIVIEELLQAQIASYLLSKGFSAISFQVVNGNLVLAGRYSEEDAKSYKQFLTEVKKIHGIKTVQNMAIETTPQAARIDLSSKYHVTGIAKRDGNNYSVVANGKIITVGENVDGLKVTSILANTILLEKDGIKYKIDFGY